MEDRYNNPVIADDPAIDIKIDYFQIRILTGTCT